MPHKRTRKGIAALVGFGLIASLATTATAAESDQVLRVSAKADRSSDVALDGKNIHGAVYVFAAVGIRTTSVSFYVDDNRRQSAPIRIETEAPFDLAGTNAQGIANAFTTSTLAEGRHTLVAVIGRQNRDDRVVRATFTVANNTSPSTTTTTVRPATTTTIRPATTTTVLPATTTTIRNTTTTSSTSTTTPSSGQGSWWKPTATNPLQLHWMLDGALDVNNARQMGLIALDGTTLPAPDAYDIDGEQNTKATVDALHAQGKIAICYFDAGVYETYRNDANKFPASVIGAKDIGWDGSYWLDLRPEATKALEPIMKARMQMCKDKGFNAIEPDEVVYDPSNNTGFPLTYQDVLTYSKALASWAHQMNMSIGQKDNPAQSVDLVNDFDWNLNEECYQYNECTATDVDGRTVQNLQVYVQHNKAVFIAEYNGQGELNPSPAKWAQVCTDSQKNHFNTTLFKLGLPASGGRQPCTTAKSW